MALLRNTRNEAEILKIVASMIRDPKIDVTMTTQKKNLTYNGVATDAVCRYLKVKSDFFLMFVPEHGFVTVSFEVRIDELNIFPSLFWRRRLRQAIKDRRIRKAADRLTSRIERTEAERLEHARALVAAADASAIASPPRIPITEQAQ
jgi:hypothetical protein